MYTLTKLLIILFLLGTILLILLYIPEYKYVYIYLELFLFFLWISIKSHRSNKIRLLFFNIAIVFLVFFGTEDYFSGWYLFGRLNSNQFHDQWLGTFYDKNLIEYDSIRGAKPMANYQFTGTKIQNGVVVYKEIIYSTNSNNLRVSPHDVKEYTNKVISNSKYIACFGCSFTWGQGIPDKKTYPYLIEERSKGYYQTYNFSYVGYGPHQMLRLLETHTVDSIMQGNIPSIGIYFGIMDHIARITGNYPHCFGGTYGPRYVLNSKGQVEYTGKGLETQWNTKIAHNPFYLFIRKSKLYQRTLEPRFFGWNRPEEDRELFIKTILASKNLFEKLYQGQFYVLLWSDHSNPHYKKVLFELKRNHINLITTDEISQRYQDNQKHYSFPFDGHPTPLAHSRIADYLLNELKNKIKSKE